MFSDPNQSLQQTQVSGLKQCRFAPLEIPKPGILKLAYSLDNIWLASFSMCIGLPVSATCHSWAGFMQMAVNCRNMI